MFYPILSPREKELHEKNKLLKEEVETLRQLASFLYDSHDELVNKVIKNERIDVATLHLDLKMIASTVREVIPGLGVPVKDESAPASAASP